MYILRSACAAVLVDVEEKKKSIGHTYIPTSIYRSNSGELSSVTNKYLLVGHLHVGKELLPRSTCVTS
jgi:hypothetical protein